MLHFHSTCASAPAQSSDRARHLTTYRTPGSPFPGGAKTGGSHTWQFFPGVRKPSVSETESRPSYQAGAAPEVVEIVGPDSSKEDGGLGELYATEVSREDSLASASSIGARREVLGEWGEAGEVLLRGRVEGRAGLEAVEGARVTVFFEDEKVQAVSASDGGFELVVPSGVPLDGEAFAHGYNLGRRFDLDPEEELIFRLAGATVIKGVILGPAAASFEEAQIRLWADDNRSLAHFTLAPDRLFSVTGNADGQNQNRQHGGDGEHRNAQSRHRTQRPYLGQHHYQQRRQYAAWAAKGQEQ